MDSRTNIVRTATQLFARQGFAGVSLRAIAEQVGMTKPSLLYHFRSKDELRRGVLDNLFDHWGTVLPRLLRAVTTGEGQFDALMRELLTFFSDDADRALLVVRELIDRPEEMHGRILDSLQPLVKLIADYMRRGQAAGRLQSGVDPEAYILHMIGMAISSVAAGQLLEPLLAGETDPPRERQVNELLRIARTSLFATPAAGSSQRPDKNE